MKTKEVKIQVPKGFEIDKNNAINKKQLERILALNQKIQ